MSRTVEGPALSGISEKRPRAGHEPAGADHEIGLVSSGVQPDQSNGPDQASARGRLAWVMASKPKPTAIATMVITPCGQ